MEEVAMFFAIISIAASVGSCHYELRGKIESEKPFIQDRATYQCKKTNELVVDK